MTHNIIHDEEILNEIIGAKVSVSSSGLNIVYQDEAEEIAKQYAEHTLVKFIDSEVERLEKAKRQDRCDKDEDCPWCERKMYCRGREDAIGYNESITDQITHLQSSKAQLTKKK